MVGDVVAYVVGIFTVLVPARWCQKRRDHQHEVEGVEGRWREELYTGEKRGGGCCGGGGA